MLRLLGFPSQSGTGLFPRRGYEVVALANLQADHRISRSEIAVLLWPETSSERAYGNLRYVLASIRKWEKANGQSLLRYSGDMIELCGETDLSQAMRLSASSEPAEFRSALKGELLEGHGGEHEGFDDWLAHHRSLLNTHILSVLADIGTGPAPTDFDDILELAAGRFPYDEQILRIRVAALARQGRMALAASHVEAFRQRLRRDLGIDLNAETQTWIKARLSVEPAARIHAAGPTSATDMRPMSAADTVKPVSAADTVKLVSAAEPVQQAVSHDPSGLPRLVLLPPRIELRTAEALAAKSLISEVTLALCRLRTFAMFAPHTARQLALEDAEEQAHRLGADYFISTELLGRNRLGFRLIHLPTRALLASEAVDLTELGMASEELAKTIAASVSQHIARVELSAYRRSGEASAFVHYLLGCERLQYDLIAVRKARKHFIRALDLSPYFVQAKAMLARTLNMEWLLLSREDTELLDQAEDLAQQALDVDPLAPAGHWEIGNILLYRRRMDESLHHIRSARHRAPHLADILSDEADVLVHLGEGSLASAKIEAAIHLNPLPPDEYRWVQGSADFISGDYQSALDHLRMMKDQRPVARMMAASAAMVGDRTAANRYRRIWLERYPDFRIADWVKIIPVKKPEAIDQMVEALRRAGFS